MFTKYSVGVLLAAAALSGCGGGGGGGGGAATSPVSAATTYQAVATAGELISYSVDTTALTYSYRVVESAYGKTGATGSGTLTRNVDGTFTPSGFQGKVAVLDNGLLMGQIYEDLDNNGTKDIIPVIGVSNPISSIAEAAGIYNFVSLQCSNVACFSYYGTVKVDPNGTWVSCVRGNLAAPAFNCVESMNGGISNFSEGRANITVNNVRGGSLIAFKDSNNGQKVVLLDLNGASALGKGAVFAASQGLPASADGNWHYVHSNGSVGIASVTGQNISDSGRSRNGSSYGPTSSTFVVNQPWNGLVTTANGGLLMPAGSGLYAGYFGANGISVGVKK